MKILILAPCALYLVPCTLYFVSSSNNQTMFRLDGKKAAVTGSGSGIGKAVAVLFATQGAETHLLDLNEEAAKETSNEIQRQNGKAVLQVCDVSSQAQLKDVFSRIGGVDILVNSAGVSHVGKAENTEEADFDRIYQVNVKGVYNCMRAAIPYMKQRKKGVILNLASIANNVGLTDRFAYSMSKGAVYAMTLSVARDYIHDGIRCNCISPARVHTPFVDGFLKKNYPGKEQEMFDKLSKSQPIGRMATPEEIAYLILYLCSDEASFITGCDYPIDGGFIKLNN
jgi:NAD(P)-dependent dehydrogenase (short-subunit alcohol dehydrogenase family)